MQKPKIEDEISEVDPDGDPGAPRAEFVNRDSQHTASAVKGHSDDERADENGAVADSS